jgi:hypothetical protein
MLRYSVTYDAAWAAISPSLELRRHVRIDSVTNGWVIPARRLTQPIVIVNATAAGQAFLEALGLAAMVTYLLSNFVRAQRRRPDAFEPSCNQNFG